MKRKLKVVLSPALVIAMFLMANAKVSGAVNDSDETPASKTRANAVRGQIIVKYRDSVTYCVHCIVQKGLNLSHAVHGNGKNLDDLHSRYGVYSAQPVFRTVAEEGRAFGTIAEVPVEALKQYHRNKLNLHRSRYPTIASRGTGGELPELHHVYVLQLSEGADVSAAVEEFGEDPNVEYAQPNFLMEADLNPNDKYYRSSGSWKQRYDDLWALKQNKLNMSPAWDLSQGQGIVVAVVDTGLDYNHRDIAGNVWSNPKETDGNNMDDDGNGYIDDHRGWDFVTCTTFDGGDCIVKKEEDNDPMDENFHGTHVSGTVAAIGGNKRGIIGMAPKAQIMPVRALNDEGRGQNSDLAAAIVYAASNGADVINNSWSCGFCPRNPLIEDAVITAYKQGSVVVFSAGNQAINVRGKSPQNMHDFRPLIVAASNQNDQPAFFTNFGSTVDVTAPGGGLRSKDANILSLRPTDCDHCPKRLTVDDEYLRLQGTSMSTPHVSGLAALILAQRPSLKVEEVRQIIRGSSKDIGAPGFDFYNGAGRIYPPDALDRTVPLSISINGPKHLSGSAPKSIPVKGTVSGPGLAGYQLFFMQENTTEWVPIGGARSGQINNGVLGNFPGQNIPLGWHTLKLEATAQDGKRYDDVIDFALALPSKRIKTKPRNAAHNPDISGDLVVYAQDVVEGVTSNLIVYDLKSKKKTKITDVPIAYPIPRISGNVIAWLIDLDERSDGVYFCQYNRQNGKCPAKQLSSNEATGLPSVSGNYIVWGEFLDGREPIFLYDISKDETIEIGEGNEAEIDGNDVVIKYVYPGRSKSDLYHYDIKAKKLTKLTKNPKANEFRPSISGRKIVFLRNHVLGNRPPHFDIYLYDLDTGKETKLVEDPEGLIEMDFSGSSVVWRHGLFEIHSYDLNTGLSERLSFFPLGIRLTPAVSDKTAVWLLKDPTKEDNGEVYFLKLQ